MKNLTKPRVLIVNDTFFETMKDQLSFLLGDDAVVSFPNEPQARAYLKDCEDQALPNIYIVDAGEMRVHRSSVVQYLIDERNGNIPEDILCSSALPVSAVSGAQNIRDQLGSLLDEGQCSVNSTGAVNSELRTIVNFSEKEKLDWRNFSSLAQILNNKYGYALPNTQESHTQYNLEHFSYHPREAISLVRLSKLSKEEALLQMKGELLAQFTSASACRVSNETYIAENARRKRKGEPWLDWKSFGFKHKSGEAAQGRVIFSLDDLPDADIAQPDEKYILILEHYDSQDIAPILEKSKYLAGLIVLEEDEVSAHIAPLLNAHNVSGLYGVGWGRLAINYSFDDGVLHLSEDKEEGGKVEIVAGQKVTIDTSFGTGKLITTEVDVEVKEVSLESETAIQWLREEIGGAHTALYANLDRPAQIEGISQVISGNFTGAKTPLMEGVGLVRTEHFVQASAEQKQLFKQVVLSDGEERERALETLQSLHRDDLQTDLSNANALLKGGVCIRLFDMPPVEIFVEEELEKVQRLYGDENIRGVQLAREIPALYEGQIRAIMQALVQSNDEFRSVVWRMHQRDRQAAQDKLDARIVKILVPNTRHEDEITFVKEMVERIATEEGVNLSNIKFGSMLETVDACNNIESIVPHCDFLSIGSNDLTSEVLNIARDDWALRREFTQETGRVEDPFLVIHENVVARLSEACECARSVKPDIEIGLCGEHGQDLTSLERLAPLQLNSVSIPPNRYREARTSLHLLYNQFP